MTATASLHGIGVPRVRSFEGSDMRPDRVIDVMLVDSRAVVREGLRAVIASESDLTVVAQAATVGDVRTLAVTPDVIVTDIDLTDANGENVIRGLRAIAPESSILVFTPVDDHAKVRSVLAAGANGYVLETADVVDLLDGIRAVADGRTYLQPSLGAEFARSRRAGVEALGLSAQEERVLGLLALGHTNAEVARLCGVSLRTIEARRAHILRRLGRRTRAELVEYARTTGILQFDVE
jgi:two-component system, NarL family, response regulator NreC